MYLQAAGRIPSSLQHQRAGRLGKRHVEMCFRGFQRIPNLPCKPAIIIISPDPRPRTPSAVLRNIKPSYYLTYQQLPRQYGTLRDVSDPSDSSSNDCKSQIVRPAATARRLHFSSRNTLSILPTATVRPSPITSCHETTTLRWPCSPQRVSRTRESESPRVIDAPPEQKPGSLPALLAFARPLAILRPFWARPSTALVEYSWRTAFSPRTYCKPLFLG